MISAPSTRLNPSGSLLPGRSAAPAVVNRNKMPKALCTACNGLITASRKHSRPADPLILRRFLFYDDFHHVAGFHAVARIEAVEDTEALDLAVGDRHPAGQAIDRVAVADGDNPQPQRPRRLALG